MENKVKPGRNLERSVRLIQEAILKSEPAYKGTEFTVESNKIIQIEGVHHEIDVLVTTLRDTKHEATWVFECKDWKDPVGKNEIIILAEKVDALKANRGYIVARELTKDAQAQLQKSERLEFVRFIDDFQAPFRVECLSHSVDFWPMRLFIKERGVPAIPNPPELAWRQTVCVHYGETMSLLRLLMDLADKAVVEDRKQNVSKYGHVGSHWQLKLLRTLYPHGGLRIDDMDVEAITVVLVYWFYVRSQRLISKFELADQGRTYHFEPFEDEFSGRTIEIEMVQRI